MSSRHIEVRDACVTFPGVGHNDSVRALGGVSLRIEDGERVGIIGANGAGKSTLLQLISGVLQPTSGSVEVKGNVHAILSVGMGLRETATGRENLYLDGALLGRTPEQTSSRLQEMIDFAELGELIDRPLRTYSTGMKARLGFASLITIDPEILIIDEALSVGDAFFGQKATDAMRRVTSKGAIVVLVSHSIGDIIHTCDRCIWMDNGVIRAEGGSVEVTDQYRAEINARQSAEILRKFGAGAAGWSKNSDLVISRVELVGADDRKPRTLLESGEHALLEITITGDDTQRARTFRVWAERNDGLILFDEQVEMKAASSDPSGRRLVCDLGVLDWRPFVYQFHVENIEARGPSTHNSATVKIWSDVTVSGGAPMIRNAMRISTSKPEEKSLENRVLKESSHR